MVIYFIMLTVIALGIIFLAFMDDEGEALGIVLILWFALVFLPSQLHTYKTQVTDCKKNEFRIVHVSKYMSLLMSDLKDDNPHTTKITSSYVLEKIHKGEFKVQKHTHKNIWGGLSAGVDEYFVITTKK